MFPPPCSSSAHTRRPALKHHQSSAGFLMGFVGRVGELEAYFVLSYYLIWADFSSRSIPLCLGSGDVVRSRPPPGRCCTESQSIAFASPPPYIPLSVLMRIHISGHPTSKAAKDNAYDKRCAVVSLFYAST